MHRRSATDDSTAFIRGGGKLNCYLFPSSLTPFPPYISERPGSFIVYFHALNCYLHFICHPQSIPVLSLGAYPSFFACTASISAFAFSPFSAIAIARP